MENLRKFPEMAVDLTSLLSVYEKLEKISRNCCQLDIITVSWYQINGRGNMVIKGFVIKSGRGQLGR